MKDELVTKLAALGLKNAQIERDLDLPKNSLSAVINGHKEMPDKWVPKVEAYLLSKTEPLAQKEEAKPLRDPLRPWIQEIEEYCLKTGIFPDYLIEFHQMHANSEITKALQHIKKSLGTADSRKITNPDDPATKQMREPPPGSNAYYLRQKDSK